MTVARPGVNRLIISWAVMCLCTSVGAEAVPTATSGVMTRGIDTWWRAGSNVCPAGTTLEGNEGKRIYCADKMGRASGRATAWHDNGKLAADGTYAEGRENGFVRTWNESGDPVIEAHYRAGVLSGKAILCGGGKEQIHWDPRDGNRKLAWYKNGGKAAELTFGADGKVLQEVHFCRKAAEITFLKGKEHGVAYAWHENGQLASRSVFHSGHLEGEAFTWHDNGERASVVNYVGGALHGKSTTWHANGRVAAVGSFVGGKKDGEWTHWFENGRGSRTFVWKLGKNITATVATVQ